MGCTCSKALESGARHADIETVDLKGQFKQRRSSSAKPAIDTIAGKKGAGRSFSGDQFGPSNSTKKRGSDGVSCGGSSSSESCSSTAWDQYSVRNPSCSSKWSGAPVGQAKRQLPSADVPASSPPGNSLRLRQDSIFGITTPRQHSTIKDTQKLQLCKVCGCTFVNQYLVIKYLGKGSCGRVFLCMDVHDQQLYAVKIVKKRELEAGKGGGRSGRKRNPLEDLRQEIAVMRRMHHPNVVSLREVVDDGASSKMLLVMDYFEGGPVMTREGLERGHRIPEPVARFYFRHMVQALDYLHSHRVVHGDLKPENALMCGGQGRVALSDFGCAKVLVSEEDELDRCNGTPAFLAPEMMKPNARFRGCPADMYALGACLYTFVFGRIPFSAHSVMRLFEIVQSTPVAFPDSIAASRDLKDLLLGMLAKDPSQRTTLPQVMTHPWVTLGGRFPMRTWREQQAAQRAQQGPEEPPPPRCSSRDGEGCGGGEMRGQGDAEIEGGHEVARAALMGDKGQAADDDGDLFEREDHLAGLVAEAGEGVEVVTVPPGQPLFRRGEKGWHLYVILEGECEVRYTPSHSQTPPATPTSTPATTPASSSSRVASSACSPQGVPLSVSAATSPQSASLAAKATASLAPQTAHSAHSTASSAQQAEQQREAAQVGGSSRRALSFQGRVEGGDMGAERGVSTADAQQQPDAAAATSSVPGPHSAQLQPSSSSAAQTSTPGRDEATNGQLPPLPRREGSSLTGGGSLTGGPLGVPPSPPTAPRSAAPHPGSLPSPSPSPSLQAEASDHSFHVGPAAPGRRSLQPCFSNLSVNSVLASHGTGRGGRLGETGEEDDSSRVELVTWEASERDEGPAVEGVMTSDCQGEGAAGTQGDDHQQHEMGESLRQQVCEADWREGLREDDAESGMPPVFEQPASQVDRNLQQQQRGAPDTATRRGEGGRSSGEGEGEGFSFGEQGARRRPPPLNLAAVEEGEAVTPSFASPYSASLPFAHDPSAAGEGAASRAPAQASPQEAGPAPSPTPPNTAVAGPSGDAESAPGRGQADSTAGVPPGSPHVPPAADAAVPPAQAALPGGGSLMSPGPHVRHLSVDMDNAYDSAATPAKESGAQESGRGASEEEREETELPPALLQAALQVQTQVSQLQREDGRGGVEYMVGVRGPGQILGEMELLAGSGARRGASAVALTPLRAVVVPFDAAREHLTKCPLAKQQLAELMWVHQSENIVVEALVRLAVVGREVQQARQQQGGQQEQGSCGGPGGQQRGQEVGLQSPEGAGAGAMPHSLHTITTVAAFHPQ